MGVILISLKTVVDGTLNLDDSNLTELEDGTYEQGRLLRTRYTRSDGYQGTFMDFDTGLIKPEFRDSSVVFVDQYTDDTKTTHDKTFLFVYDMFGRGWKIDVKKEFVQLVHLMVKHS